MPNIAVKIPAGAFPGDARAELARRIAEAATTVEQIPADRSKRFLLWIQIDEIAAGMWTCGGIDLSSQVLPCFAMIHVPAGVLDTASRALYVKLVHHAFEQAMPADDTRPLATSVIVEDVADGTWGGNGAIWTLPVLAKAAGYAHLQHLVAAD